MNTEDDLNSALALHRSGQLDAAAAIYRRLYERDGNDADACYGLGTVLMAQKELSQAAELLDIAVRLQPDVPEFLYNHALALDQLDQGDQARASLLRAAELCVSDPELLPAICRKLIDLGLDAAAQRFLPACIAFFSTLSASSGFLASNKRSAKASRSSPFGGLSRMYVSYASIAASYSCP